MRLRWLAIGLVSLIAPRHAAAELWSSLESYVLDSTLIVKARAVRQEVVRGEVSWTFQAVETWKGVYRPSLFVAPAPGGGFHAADGEHGVNEIAIGAEVVFFFDASDRSDGKIRAHSTAFPIRDDSVVYASTAHSPCAPGTPRGTRGCRETYSTAEFKLTIVNLVRAQAGCGDLLRIRMRARERGGWRRTCSTAHPRTGASTRAAPGR